MKRIIFSSLFLTFPLALFSMESTRVTGYRVEPRVISSPIQNVIDRSRDILSRAGINYPEVSVTEKDVLAWMYKTSFCVKKNYDSNFSKMNDLSIGNSEAKQPMYDLFQCLSRGDLNGACSNIGLLVKQDVRLIKRQFQLPPNLSFNEQEQRYAYLTMLLLGFIREVINQDPERVDQDWLLLYLKVAKAYRVAFDKQVELKPSNQVKASSNKPNIKELIYDLRGSRQSSPHFNKEHIFPVLNEWLSYAEDLQLHKLEELGVSREKRESVKRNLAPMIKRFLDLCEQVNQSSSIRFNLFLAELLNALMQYKEGHCSSSMTLTRLIMGFSWELEVMVCYMNNEQLKTLLGPIHKNNFLMVIPEQWSHSGQKVHREVDLETENGIVESKLLYEDLDQERSLSLAKQIQDQITIARYRKKPLFILSNNKKPFVAYKQLQLGDQVKVSFDEYVKQSGAFVVFIDLSGISNLTPDQVGNLLVDVNKYKSDMTNNPEELKGHGVLKDFSSLGYYKN